MALLQWALFILCWASTYAKPTATDPCIAIGGKTWVAPSDVRDCLESFPLNETIRNNIIDVVNLTFNFHTSINYQIEAPEPFTNDVQVNIAEEIQRIRTQAYESEFAFHLDLSQTITRLQDGHAMYYDYCYDYLFGTSQPFPVVLLNDGDEQQVHIAPEAFDVSSVYFGNEISFWENEAYLDLQKFSGATVLAIDGNDPWDAINENAKTTGYFQAQATRQNRFFSSYFISNAGWSYNMGDFAQRGLPLVDEVTLKVIPVGSNAAEDITVPYRSWLSGNSVPFTDGPSLRAGNCVARTSTNGFDQYAPKLAALPTTSSMGKPGRFPFDPFVPSPSDRKHAINAIVVDAPALDISLPPTLAPSQSVSGVGGIQFYQLDDGKTGVLALGSFSSTGLDEMETQLLNGLQTLKGDGSTQLIIDLNNNIGGYICISEWLHRIIIGPNSKSEPQAGLDTEARDQTLAQLIVKQIVDGVDPDNRLWYNPVNWHSANGTQFDPNEDWLQPPVERTINGVPDMFSQRLGRECQPFNMEPPSEQLFAPDKIVLLSNGGCSSSCASFSIALSKHYDVTTVVVGGKQGTTQQYAGSVGGQALSFADIDTEVKTAHLKDNSLAPPDFLTNSYLGITWRLGFGITDPTQPEEWQEHPATINFPLTASTVNNPRAIWDAVAEQVFG